MTKSAHVSVFYIKIYKKFSYGILGNIYTNIDVSVMSHYHLIILTIDWLASRKKGNTQDNLIVLDINHSLMLPYANM